MEKKYTKVMFVFLALALTLQTITAQQDVFSRDNVTTGNFGDAQLPWFYATDNNSQGDPDSGNTIRNFVKIGHNNNTTMTTNGRFYLVAALDFQATATSPRTINNAGGGLSASGGVYNASPATHTFNTPIGIDGTIVQLHTNAAGDLIFNSDIFINSNTVQFGNAGTGEITVNGSMQGTGNVEKIGDNTLTITGTHTYSGTTSIDAGIVILQGDLTNSAITVKSGATLEIDGNSTVNSITVEAGGYVQVNSGQTLTVTNDLTLESISTSYSSLISDGTIVGTVNYKRHVNGNSALGDPNAIGDNDLISAPLSGQTFGDFATANPNLLANPSNPPVKAFAIFNKTTGTFQNYSTTTNAGTILDAGIGYRAASNNTATLTFTGTVNTGIVSNNIVNSGPAVADWNLVGNPYPSYINVRDFLNHEVALGVKNLDLFVETSAAVYGYNASDGAPSRYTIYNLANAISTAVIAPGQGFYVSADAAQVAAYDLAFSPDIRSTGTEDDFIVGRGIDDLVNLKLQISAASKDFFTDLYFNESATLGLDRGYDAAFFGSSSPAFSLYSHLVNNNTGISFAIQALGETDYGNTTVALGVNANQGEQLTFTVANNTLPSTVDVYLDDTVANTNTLLNTGDYILTPSSALSGTGRFFLRFEDSALSTTENSINNISIYTNQTNETVIIVGQLLEQTTANVYDLQGRLITSKVLDTTSRSQSIDVSNLNTGIYVVQLNNTVQNKTQKIILH